MAMVPYTISSTLADAQSVTAADVDGNGTMDVIAVGFAELYWYSNTTGSGSSWSADRLAFSLDIGSDVAAGDLNGDGHTDIVVVSEGGAVTWFENDGAGGDPGFSDHVVSTTFSGAWSVEVVDLDGDGDLDLLAAAHYDDDIAWFENTAGDGSAWTERTIDSSYNGARAARAADVDGDGDLDVVGCAELADSVVWWENSASDASTWVEHTIANSVGMPFDVQVGDIDGDGDVDVAGVSSDIMGPQHMSWWENGAGDGSAWTERVFSDDFGMAVAAALGDLDGDGDMDVLGAAYEASEIS